MLRFVCHQLSLRSIAAGKKCLVYWFQISDQRQHENTPKINRQPKKKANIKTENSFRYIHKHCRTIDVALLASWAWNAILHKNLQKKRKNSQREECFSFCFLSSIDPKIIWHCRIGSRLRFDCSAHRLKRKTCNNFLYLLIQINTNTTKTRQKQRRNEKSMKIVTHKNRLTIIIIILAKHSDCHFEYPFSEVVQATRKYRVSGIALSFHIFVRKHLERIRVIFVSRSRNAESYMFQTIRS